MYTLYTSNLNREIAEVKASEEVINFHGFFAPSFVALFDKKMSSDTEFNKADYKR